jgi:hypothetical protein
MENTINASFSEVVVSSIKKRGLSNEQKIILGKWKLYQAYFAVKDLNKNLYLLH